jgi:hypothetical protein
MLAGKGFTLSGPRAIPSRTSPPHLGQKVRVASGLRSHLHVKASAAARSISAVKDQIFNRNEELAALNLRLDNDPKDMLILLGPANCGKSVSFNDPLRSFVTQLILCLLLSNSLHPLRLKLYPLVCSAYLKK